MAFNQIFDYLYGFLYIVLIWLAYVSWRRPNIKNRYAKYAILITFVFIAFRAPVVGGDTLPYLRYLSGQRNYYSVQDLRDLEYLFTIYREIIRTITSSWLIIMIINTLISMAPVFYLLKKYSYNVPLSLLFFFYIHCTFVYFCALRQIMGFSFILWGLIYYLYRVEHDTNRIIDYKGLLCLILSIFIAYGFHTSSIVIGLLILILMFIPGNNQYLYYILICSSFIVGVILKSFDSVSILSDFYGLDVGVTERINVYLQSEQENEDVGVNILWRQSLLALISILFMEKEQRKHIFVKLFVVGTLLYNLFYNIPMISRLLPIFNVFGIVCLTWIFGTKYKKSSRYRMKVNIVSLLLVLYFSRSEAIQLANWDREDFTRLHPYYFVFQDYSDHPSLNSMRQD